MTANSTSTGSTAAAAAAAAAATALSEKQGMAVILWSVGMFCILGWDWLINLSHEVERIWKRKFTHITWLYLLTRYYGLVKNAVNIVLLTRPITGIITNSQCLRIYKWQPVSALISIQLTHAILGLRVYALYGKSRTVAALLLTIMLAEFGVQVKTMTVVFPIPEPPGVILPCIAIGPEQWLVAFWSMPLLFDGVVFGLTILKTITFWRKDIQSRTLSSFFRDGLVYFFGIFSMNLINVILFVTQDSSLQPVNLPATLMLNIILACRLVLNLRAPHKFQSSYASGGTPFAGMGDTTANASTLPTSSFKMGTISNQMNSVGDMNNTIHITSFVERDLKPAREQDRSHWIDRDHA